ncbi:MAG: hypothetical protein ACTHN5_00825 [Phycisphaerae bacterium]
MAIYTTFFLAKPDELQNGFPGWKPPLPVPVRREFRNPFTKQIMIVETREPEWPNAAKETQPSQYRAVAIHGNYEDYLEGRLPPFVRECQHWAAKGLTEIELEPLLKAIGVNIKLDSPLYAPPSSGVVLQEFPPDFLAKLIESDPLEVTRKWAAEMSGPEHTHSVTGRKLNDGWTTDQASQVFTPIASLARRASLEQRMYLLTEA